MRLKDKIIKDIDQMEPGLLPMVYDYYHCFKTAVFTGGSGDIRDRGTHAGTFLIKPGPKKRHCVVLRLSQRSFFP
jgi:hypothetical protein